MGPSSGAVVLSPGLDCIVSRGYVYMKTHTGCDFFIFCKPHPQVVSDQKNTSIPFKSTGMKGLAIKSIPSSYLVSHSQTLRETTSYHHGKNDHYYDQSF